LLYLVWLWYPQMTVWRRLRLSLQLSFLMIQQFLNTSRDYRELLLCRARYQDSRCYKNLLQPFDYCTWQHNLVAMSRAHFLLIIIRNFLFFWIWKMGCYIQTEHYNFNKHVFSITYIFGLISLNLFYLNSVHSR